MKDLILGIDPGVGGGAVLLKTDGTIFDVQKWEDESTFLNFVGEYEDDILHCFIEKVYSSGQMSHDRAFKFGDNAAVQRGICLGAGIPVSQVVPQKWQALLDLPKVDNKTDHKNNLKSAANKIWPSTSWTHALADAALIAHYGLPIALSNSEEAH